MDTGVSSQAQPGCSELVASIVAALQHPDRKGVLLAGDAGLGKTALARGVLRQLGPTVKPFWIFPAAALAQLPFGALAPYLDSFPLPEPASWLAVLRRMQDVLRRRLDAGEPMALVIVEDAWHLDADSSRVLAHLAVTGLVKLVVLSRKKPEPPAAFVSLWDEGLLQRFDLSPLTDAEAAALCGQVLGGDMVTSDSTALNRIAGGNPLFLLSLIRQGQRSGELVLRNHVWMLRNFHLRVDQQLRDLVREQLAARSAAERAILETVALAEPMPLVWLQQLGKESDVDTLEEDRLITIARGPHRLVRPASPLLGAVLRDLVPPARSMTIRSLLLAVADGVIPEETQTRLVCWSLECGAAVSDEQLLGAAASANRHFEPMVALQTAEAVSGEVFRAAAKVQLAEAHVHLGDLPRAASLLQDCIESAADPATAEAASRLAARVHLGMGGQVLGLRRIAAAWRASERRLDAGSAGSAVRGPWGSRLLLLHALHLEGRYAEIEAELVAGLADTGADPVTRTRILYLWAELLAATGRPDSAARASGEILQLLGGSSTAQFRAYELARFKYSLALVRLGRWNLVARPLEEAPWHGFRSGVHFGGGQPLVSGLAALRQGDMMTALGRLEVAVEALIESDFDQLLPYALGLAAYAASLLGRNDVVDRYGEAYNGVPYQGSLHFQLLGQAHLAAARAAVQGAAAGIRELAGLADRARRAGLLAAERDARELALRLGDNSQLARLVELTNHGEGPEAECLNAYARGLLERDAEQLLAAGERAQERRYFLLAAECLGKAVSFLNGTRDPRRVRAVAQLLHLRRNELAGISALPLFGPDDATSLTAREREIVIMVTNGNTNREIAELSSLSVRTVEGHLYRIFSKLGINRREDLKTVGLTTVRSGELSPR
ncbi:LuxR C-terminal-related transcriptional regulator [Arthrobacter sp. Hor0625]|uniref:LuxR C-terminal-related transcriptional regulator n=1 Tax=Arthrobacter sp. Hor0625 TaxID=3457358 RepID=UPI00403ECC38